MTARGDRAAELRRQYALDVFLAGQKGGPEGRPKGDGGRAEGGRFVGNHLSPALQPAKHPDQMQADMRAFLLSWGLGEDDLAPEQLVDGAAVDRFQENVDVAREHNPDASGATVLSADAEAFTREHLATLLNGYVQQCLPLIKQLHSQASALRPEVIESVVVYDPAVADFIQDRMEFFANKGLIDPTTFLRTLGNHYYGIGRSSLEKLPIVFYHLYAFSQENEGADFDAEDFIAYLQGFSEVHPQCGDTKALVESEAFLAAIHAGRFNDFYVTIVANSAAAAAPDLPADLGAWQESIDAHHPRPNPADVLAAQEALIAGYEVNKGSCLLLQLVEHVAREKAEAFTVRSNHALPIALPFLVAAFHSGAAGASGEAISEANLTRLLQGYLLNREGQLDLHRFALLMQYSREPYSRTNRADCDQGQLLELNYDLVFRLLGSDPVLSDALQAAGVTVAHVDDTRLARPAQAYVGGVAARGAAALQQETARFMEQVRNTVSRVNLDQVTDERQQLLVMARALDSSELQFNHARFVDASIRSQLSNTDPLDGEEDAARHLRLFAMAQVHDELFPVEAGQDEQSQVEQAVQRFFEQAFRETGLDLQPVLEEVRQAVDANPGFAQALQARVAEEFKTLNKDVGIPVGIAAAVGAVVGAVPGVLAACGVAVLGTMFAAAPVAIPVLLAVAITALVIGIAALVKRVQQGNRRVRLRQIDRAARGENPQIPLMDQRTGQLPQSDGQLRVNHDVERSFDGFGQGAATEPFLSRSRGSSVNGRPRGTALSSHSFMSDRSRTRAVSHVPTPGSTD